MWRRFAQLFPPNCLQLTEGGAAALRSDDESAISTLLDQASSGTGSGVAPALLPDASLQSSQSKSARIKRKAAPSTAVSSSKQANAGADAMEDEVIDLTPSLLDAAPASSPSAQPEQPSSSDFPSMLEILQLPGPLLMCVRMRRLPPSASTVSQVELVATAAWPPDIFGTASAGAEAARR